MPVTIRTSAMEYKDPATGEYVGISGVSSPVDFSIATKVFGTVAEMIADQSLIPGDNVATRGYYTSGDDGGMNYVISSAHEGVFYMTLSNGLYANLLSEKGLLRAESIGIKAYAASTNNPDSSDMERNVALFNTAHYNGVYIVFGRGHFYFSSPLLLSHRGTYTVQGIDRSLTTLHFPNSDGLYFCDARYYNYYVVQKLRIDSYGHCILCDESCLTVLDSHFEWLLLNSETGDCFHGPRYNVAKYASQGGERIIYDTCVQNCVFDFINASAPNGAAFCNIMGMYTYYQHLNFVSCRYAFRNCDGILRQSNTLGSTEEYFIYYDKTNSYSLHWRFESVNAEGIGKAFIFTEPESNAGDGEDPKKPETANHMTLSITAINSGWSLNGNTENNDVYPITVHALSSITLIGSTKIVAPTRYPDAYDTDAVRAHIKCTRSFGLSTYIGGPDVDIYCSGSNQMCKYYGTVNNVAVNIGNNGGYPNLTNRRVPAFTEVYADVIYGGKGLNVWDVKASEIGGQPNPPAERYCFDVFAVNVDTDTDKTIGGFQTSYNSIYPGRMITLANKKESLHDLVLASVNNNRMHSNFALSKECIGDIRLAPGESVQLVMTYEDNPSNSGFTYVWRPVDKKYIRDDDKFDALFNAIKAISEKEICDVTDGYYIPNTGANADINSATEGTASNGNYGIRYVLAQCEPGDVFRIINGRGAGSASKLWAFISSGGSVLSVAGTAARIDNGTITAPANAAYLIVNSFTKPIVFKESSI